MIPGSIIFYNRSNTEGNGETPCNKDPGGSQHGRRKERGRKSHIAKEEHMAAHAHATSKEATNNSRMRTRRFNDVTIDTNQAQNREMGKFLGADEKEIVSDPIYSYNRSTTEGTAKAPYSEDPGGSEYARRNDRGRKVHIRKEERMAAHVYTTTMEANTNSRMRTRSFKDAAIGSNQDSPMSELKKHGQRENGRGTFPSVDKDFRRCNNKGEASHNAESFSYTPSIVDAPEFYFQLFIKNENGIKLYIDLGSASLFDWLKSRAPEPLPQDSNGQCTVESSHSNGRFTISSVGHHCLDNGIITQLKSCFSDTNEKNCIEESDCSLHHMINNCAVNINDEVLLENGSKSMKLLEDSYWKQFLKHSSDSTELLDPSSVWRKSHNSSLWNHNET